MRGLVTTASFCLAAGFSLVVGRVHAQQPDCSGQLSLHGDQLDVTPPDGAQGVALDAPMLVRYPEHTDLDALQASVPQAAGDPCSGEIVCVFEDESDSGGSSRVPVAGRVTRMDDHSLAFRAATGFAAHSRYFAEIARPGFDTASRTEIELETGGTLDRQPPKLTSAGAIMLEVDAPPSECHAAAGSLRVKARVPPATDDGDQGSIELLLYLTRAAGLSGPVLVDRGHNPESGHGALELGFLLDRQEKAAPVCVALRAIDGVGKLSQTEPELCFDPAPGRYFASCGVSLPGRGAGSPVARRGSLVAWALGLTGLALSRRRRGPRRPA